MCAVQMVGHAIECFRLGASPYLHEPDNKHAEVVMHCHNSCCKITHLECGRRHKVLRKLSYYACG
jgi:hypothetical protein